MAEEFDDDSKYFRGEVANEYGDLRGWRGRLIKVGYAIVTREQAETAAAYGWKRTDERYKGGLVAIARNSRQGRTG
jgi:hypothetical protein